MLKFAQIGAASDEVAEADGVDRAELRKQYEEALRFISAGKALEAKQGLKHLVSVRSSAARDRLWLRGFKVLCWQNLAGVHQQLGQHQKALAYLERAVRGVGKDSPTDARLPLLRRLADCAVRAENWPAATQAFCRCLRLQPADAECLRKLAQSLLQAGDLQRCREVLAQLKASHGLEDQEDWLMSRLKRRFDHSWYRSMEGAPPQEADYLALSAARAKRRKSARQAHELPPVEQQLMHLSVVELMQTMRSMVTSSCLFPFQPVVFVLRGANAEEQQQEQPAPSEEAAHRSPAAMTSAVLDSLRALMVEPWPLSGSAVQWLLHILDSLKSSENSSPAMYQEESRAVAGFLALPQAEAGEGRRSRCQSFRSWLFDVLRFTSERGREGLRLFVDHCKLTSLQVELLGGAVLLSRQQLRSETVETFSGVRAFWAHSSFLVWTAQIRGGDDPEPRQSLLKFVEEFGLSLAESCVTASDRMPWLQQPALSLLRAWLYWHPRIGLAETQHLRLRLWVEEGLGFDGVSHPGRLQTEHEEQLAAELCRVDSSQRGADVLRCLWAASSIRQALGAKELALLRCRALLAVHGFPVQNSAGEQLSLLQVEARLKHVRQQLQEESSNRLEGGMELTKDVQKAREQAEKKQEIEDVDEDGEARSRETKQLEMEAMDIARSVFTALPSPLAVDQTRVKSLVRLFDWISKMEAKSDGVDNLFNSLAMMMSQLSANLVELEDGEYKMVKPPYFAAAVGCTRAAAVLLDKAAQVTQPLQELVHSNPLLLGIKRHDAEFAAFLHPACERMLIGSMLLVASLAPRVLSGSVSRDWCPVLHGLLSLNLKLLSLQLLASGNSQEPSRGGSLLVHRGKAASAAIPQNKLWLRLCRLYRTSHDLALELTEHFLRRSEESQSDMSQLPPDKLRWCTATLFGFHALTLNRISASEDSLLSMPHVMLSSALRTDGRTIRAWREQCRVWQSKVVEADAPNAWKVSLKILRKEETPSSAWNQEGDEEDTETCRVVARCLSSCWPLPGIDPEEFRGACKKDLPLERMLNNNLIYDRQNMDLSRSDDLLQLQAAKHFSDAALLKKGSEVPPHILGLAVIVNQRLDPNATSSQRLINAVASQLDAQLFSVAMDTFQPQALLHPFIFNAHCMMHMLSTEMLLDDSHQPFDDMVTVLAANAQMSNDDKAVPPESIKADFGKLSQSQDRATVFEQLLGKRAQMHQLLWEVAPNKRRTAKKPASSAAATPGQEREEERAVREYALAKELVTVASEVPPMTTLPFANSYLMLLHLRANSHQGRHQDLLEALICISKAVAISPGCQELWWSAAQTFLQLVLLQDDADSLAESWTHKLEVFTGSSEMRWSPRWKFLYGQARMLNRMWQFRLGEDVAQRLRDLLKGGQQHIPQELSDIALRWLERQLEMLVLLRCRKRYFGIAGESSLHHLKRCQHTAQMLLWFLVHCTDIASACQHMGNMVQQDWPARPPFADSWQKLAKRGTSPLICFRRDGHLRALPAYIWYVPYILGRTEWKLLKLNSASPKQEDQENIIRCLVDACFLELEARQCPPERHDRRGSRRTEEVVDTEPNFRLHTTRLAVVFQSRDGYESAGIACYDNSRELTRKNVIADALEGMKVLAMMDKWYMGKYYSCEAEAFMDAGELNSAADSVSRIVGELLRGRQFQAPSQNFSVDRLNPSVLHCQRVRKDEARKRAALKMCLRVREAIMQKVLATQAVAVLQEKPEDMLEFTKRCRGVHPGHRTQVVNALKALDKNRPDCWQALFQVLHALLRVVFASLESESNTSFELAQTVCVLRIIRDTFNTLVRADTLQAGSKELNLDSRPSLDWRLLSLLRHLCSRCRDTQRIREDPKLNKETDHLQTCFRAAAGRLHCFALGRNRAADSSGFAPYGHTGEEFFDSLKSQMPMSKELQDSLGVTIDDDELDGPASSSLGLNSFEIKEECEGPLQVDDDSDTAI